MAQTIKIKRSTGSTAPSSLAGGELAFTGGAGTYGNGGQRLFIGDPANSDAVTVIGGNYFTTMLDHQPGTLTASSAIITDSNSKVDVLKSGNIVVTGSTDTISTASGNLTIAPTASLVITHGGTVSLATQATSLTVKDNEANALDINEGGTSYLKITTTNGSEKLVVGKDTTFANDVSLLSDAAVLNFGADSDVNLTHVADTGLLLNGTSVFQFRDAQLSIGSSADGQLDVNADTELAITAPTVDIDASAEVNISNALTVGGNVDVGSSNFTIAAGTGNTVVAGTLNAQGDVDFDAALNVDGATTLNGAVTLGDASGDAITVTGTATFTPSADFDGGFTVAGSQTIDMGANRITNVGTPTQNTDAATKAYVDSVKQALDIKDSVRVATTADLSATYSNGSSGVGATLTADSNGAISVDGVSPTSGDRILVKDQSTASENGIYSVTTVGDGSNPFVLTRTTDADSSSKVTGGLFAFVEEGTSGADNAYVLTSITGTATIGTSTLTFTQFSGAGQISAGDGLSKTGNALEVNDDNITLEIASDNVRIKGITTTANGDLLYGANGSNGGYARLGIGSYDSTNSVGQLLQVGSGSTIAWSNTIDGGTFS
jgi:hypothetical protein